jgi:UDP:flavonoid glycosyltransferase YjiC (YdhE family)
MARFLFVVPPLTGHVNPTVAVGEELIARGHSVAWTGHSEIVAPLLPAWAELIPLDHELPVEMVASTREKAMTMRGVAALEFLWRDFLRPLASAMVPGVDSAVSKFAPDALVVDQQAFAGAIVARRYGLPWATSATTSAELVDPFRALPKVGEWVAGQLVELQIEAGLGTEAATSGGDLRFSEYLTIAFTTSALTGPIVLPESSGPVVMVGPSLTPRRQGIDDQPDAELAEFLGSGRCVLVTLGTVNADAGGRFFSAAVEAAESAADSGSWRAVIVAPREVVEPVAGAVFVAPFIPQLQVLGHVDAVVCHGGHNTVCETLSYGLPLVVAPIRDDQPVIAEQVESCGAGVRVRFGRVRGTELKSAIDSVLDEPRYRNAATAVRSSFAAAGGAAAAARSLEELVA